MRAQDLESINITLEELSKQKADIAHIQNVFTILRYKKGTSDFIKEIGHFINHQDKNQGQIYDIALDFIRNIVNLKNGNGGVICSIPLLITQTELLRQFIASLLHLHFEKTVISKIDNSSYLLMKSVIEILCDRTLLINRSLLIYKDDIERCELKLLNEGVVKLRIKFFFKQNSNETSFGGPNGITYGPHFFVEADLIRAIPDGLENNYLNSIVFGHENNLHDTSI